MSRWRRQQLKRARRAKYKAARLAPKPDPDQEAKKYAPVLERMVEILGVKNSKLSFGDAMKRAARELDIVIPEAMVPPLLTSAFKVISSGKIPGIKAEA